MPDRRAHNLVDRAILGKSYDRVNQWMDEPSAWLGPSHRVLRHDPVSLLIKFHDAKEVEAGLLHIALDAVDTKSGGTIGKTLDLLDAVSRKDTKTALHSLVDLAYKRHKK